MAETIERSPISDELKEKFGIYAKYTIQDRALPDARDGLKPVQRRILYGMNEEGNVPEKPYRKAAKLVGAIMGNYHPHGDSSIYEAMARMSQDWIMGAPLVDLHGNNGSIDGDGPASMRYTEVRLQKLAVDGLLTGVEKKGVIPMMDNFDGSEVEPVVLPAQFPNLLVNGAVGMAAGYAVEVLPHNLAETLRAASALLENPDITVAELMQYIPAPDFPTGGLITGVESLKQLYETGKGSVTVRSNYVIEQSKKHTHIVFTDIPYSLKKQKIVEKIDELVCGKKVAGLVEVRDETGRDGLRIVIDCVKGTEETILNYLFKHTPLQTKLHMNMTVVHDRKPQLLNLKQALKAFTDFRIETKTNELNYEKNRLEKRLHLVEGFIQLTENVQEIVAVIQESEGKADGRAQIIEKFGFTEAQAEAIVTLPLHRISKQDKRVYVDEKGKLEREINRLTALLTSDKKLIRHLINAFEKLANEFGTPRKTPFKAEEETWEVSELDVIAEETVYVAISKEGYMKRSSVRSYTATQQCGIKEGDTLVFEGQTNTKHHLVLVTNQGRHVCVPIFHVDEMRWGDEGKHISSYTVLNEGEFIQFAFTFDAEQTNDLVTIVIKANGQVRASALNDCKPSRKKWAFSGYVKMLEGDEIVYTGVHALTEAVGFTNVKGQKMFFKVDEIPITSMRSAGVRGIHIKKGETILGFEVGEVTHFLANGYPQRPRGSRGQTPTVQMTLDEAENMNATTLENTPMEEQTEGEQTEE